MLLTKFIITSTLIVFTLADSFTLRTSTSTILKCSTSFGRKSVAPPLHTSTLTESIHFLPLLGTSIYAPVQTVTPAPVTTTSTVQATATVTTTNSAVTDTFSTTSTIITTETDAAVVTSTSISTASFISTTTTSSTVLIPTSSGFLPIESTTATAYPNTPSRRFKARNNAISRRSEHGICKSSYPQSVKCVDYVEYFSTIIYIHTTTTSTTTLAPLTSTTTTTLTSTSTSTVVPPDVSTTSSFTTTVTVSITTTSTSVVSTTTSTTSTLTMTSTTSLYAACTASSDNILGPNTPTGLVEAITGSNSFVITTPGTPYDCCVQCQLSNTCAGTFFSVGSQDQDGQCIQVQSNQCASQAGFSRAYLTNPVDNGFTYIVSNGNCGYLFYGGQFN